MAEKIDSGKHWLIGIVFAVQAIGSLALIGTGAFFYAMALDTWVQDGFDFRGWGVLDWLVGLIGAGFIHAGLLVAGFFFRFLPWSGAPRASLALACVSTLYIVLTALMLSSPLDPDDTFERTLLIGAGIASLCILSLPPFLHWYSDRGLAAAHRIAMVTGGTDTRAEAQAGARRET
jgi:hypothetical protein